jgi:hypothetical protein
MARRGAWSLRSPRDTPVFLAFPNICMCAYLLIALIVLIAVVTSCVVRLYI